jgi:hypothetical protein
MKEGEKEEKKRGSSCEGVVVAAIEEEGETINRKEEVW